MLVVVVKGVEEDTETDPLIAGAKHRAFQSLRLLKKISFLCGAAKRGVARLPNARWPKAALTGGGGGGVTTG